MVDGDLDSFLGGALGSGDHNGSGTNLSAAPSAGARTTSNSDLGFNVRGGAMNPML